MKTSHACATSGFTLIELLLVVGAVLVLAGLILSALAGSHVCGVRISCLTNLKQIGLSFRTWSLDHDDKYPAQVSVTNGGTMELVESGQAWVHFLVMSNELSTPKLLICTEEPDETRRPANTFATPNQIYPPTVVPFTSDKNVSYFVGVDAKTKDFRMILSGDRNLSLDRFPANPGLLRITTNSTVG